MSDEATTTATTAEPTVVAEAAEAKTFTQDQVNAFLADQKRKVQSGFSDYDELKTKASEFDKFAESQKTEIQKAIERAEAAENALAETVKTSADQAKENLRLKIIAKHEIPEAYQEFVTGADETELEAKAEKVKTLIPSTTQEQVPLLRELYIPGEAVSPDIALNSDGLKAALEAKLGIFS